MKDIIQNLFTFTCNNVNSAVCCNSTSSLYINFVGDYGPENLDYRYGTSTYGVGNIIFNISCFDVSNNPYAETPATLNCSDYADRLEADIAFPNTTVCAWDFLTGWQQYDNSCEYITSTNYTFFRVYCIMVLVVHHYLKFANILLLQGQIHILIILSLIALVIPANLPNAVW